MNPTCIGQKIDLFEPQKARLLLGKIMYGTINFSSFWRTLGYPAGAFANQDHTSGPYSKKVIKN